MKLIQALSLLLLSFAACAQVKPMTPEEMNKQAPKSNAVFLDVRTIQEWSQ